ncbi:MAG: FIST C-terminal domain-containing protein [Betaproteobacteria bacterium]
MTIATALVSGNDALPQLAEEAVQQALDKAGLTHANGLLLFLTPEFSRHAQATVTAVARKAQCTQVAGGIASGVFTESGWTLDRPAAAVMVFGGDLSLNFQGADEQAALSYAGGNFPPEWANSGSRFGATFGGNFSGSSAPAEPLAWQQSRLTEQQRCSMHFAGAEITLGVSSGLKLLSQPLPIESSNGYDLEKLGGQSAGKSLYRVLPAELRHDDALPWHHLIAVVIDGEPAADILSAARYRPVAIIAANADNSLTLAERVLPGQYLAWAIRQPLTAENDMRQCLDQLAGKTPHPEAALMFSCIGRGPYFYGGEDRDLSVLCERFPELPVLGIYGTGQIAPANALTGSVNRQLQNAVVTALISRQI